MFGLGFPEIAIILVAVVVLFFGGKKISELGRGIGRFSGELKKGKMEIENEINEAKKEVKDDWWRAKYSVLEFWIIFQISRLPKKISRILKFLKTGKVS
jgi:sec-independent protein translocase protein TatA